MAARGTKIKPGYINRATRFIVMLADGLLLEIKPSVRQCNQSFFGRVILRQDRAANQAQQFAMSKRQFQNFERFDISSPFFSIWRWFFVSASYF